MPRGWPKGKPKPPRTYNPTATVPPAVREIVRLSIERAKRNVEDDLPFDAGSDPDAVLLALGLPPRPATFDPKDLSFDLFSDEIPLRLHPRKRKEPAA